MPTVVNFPTSNKVAIAFNQVRDATVCNEELTTAEKLGILQLVLAELLRDALEQAEL